MSKEEIKFDVSDEDITKALADLDSISAIEEDESDDLFKGEDDSDEAEEVVKAFPEKGEESEGEEDDDDDDDDDDDEDLKKGKKKAIKKSIEGEEEIDIVKALEESPMLSEFSKSLEASAAMVEKQSKANAILFKGMNERMISLQESLEELQNTPIQKSLTHARAVDRFEKGGEGAAEEVLVATDMRHKESILKGLEELAFPNGEPMNEDIAKAMATYETATELDTRYVAQLSRHLGKKVVAKG